MEKIIEAKPKRGVIAARLGLGCISLLLILAFTALAGSGTFSKMAAGAKEVRSLVCWYVQSGQWRMDAKAYLTHVEFLFCPNSATVPSMESDEDEE